VYCNHKTSVLSPYTETVTEPASLSNAEGRLKPTLVNVAENLCRVQLPVDRPGKPTGEYYALVKKGGKQFRRSLKTTKDRKLAERRLSELRAKVNNLAHSYRNRPGAQDCKGLPRLKSQKGLLLSLRILHLNFGRYH